MAGKAMPNATHTIKISTRQLRREKHPVGMSPDECAPEFTSAAPDMRSITPPIIDFYHQGPTIRVRHVTTRLARRKGVPSTSRPTRPAARVQPFVHPRDRASVRGRTVIREPRIGRNIGGRNMIRRCGRRSPCSLRAWRTPARTCAECSSSGWRNLPPGCRRHRKNSLFYKTQQGADVGDVYVSLIHTSYFAGADPLEYLIQLQRHEQQVQAEPAHWLPWNYHQQLALE
jgi:hypothetical protein